MIDGHGERKDMSSINSGPTDQTTLKRTIRVDSLAPESAEDLELLRSHEGVVSVSWNASRTALTVTYDALETSYGELTHWLGSRGWALNQGCWARWRASVYRFVDVNVRDHSRHSPACCNKPPPGAGRMSTRDR